MRGRTNVTQRSGLVPVNGNIEEYEVADGKTIEIGDFVSIISEGEDENVTTIYSGSSSTYVNVNYEYVGELNNNKIIFMNNPDASSNSKILVLDSSGNVVLLKDINILLYNKIGIKTSCLVGNYLVVCGYNSFSSSGLSKVFYLYKFSDDCKTLTQLNSYSNDSIYGYNSICAIGSNMFASVFYYSSSIKGVALFKISNDSILLLDNETISEKIESQNIISISNKTNDGFYIIARDTYDGGLLYGNVKIVSESISSVTFVNTGVGISVIKSYCYINDDTIILLSSSKLFILNIVNGEISYNTTQEIYPQSDSGFSEHLIPLFIYKINENELGVVTCINNRIKIICLSYLYNGNGVFSYNSNLGSLIDWESRVSESIFVLNLGNIYLMLYNKYLTTSSVVYKKLFSIVNEMIIQSGKIFATEYNGKSIGFAKTGGTSGKTIQVYVPKQN